MHSKKLLTLDDLYNFYLNQNKSCKFDAKKSGYPVSVQIPAQFEINKDLSDDSLLFCKVKIMHSGENRNKSSVTEDALVKASKTLAYKPVLANFMEYEDENGNVLKDFTSHDMKINEDGSIDYIEKQIGCFTADEPFFEIEESTGHNFLYGYCAIPVEYTDAVSIIERKGGTKVSVELSVNEMAYNSKQKVLELTDVVIMGLTCLGKDPVTLEDVGEGMLNARLDIADFSSENNSILKYSELVEMRDKLDDLLKHFAINETTRKEEVKVDLENKFDEVTEEEVTTTEETTEEEVTVTENESEETVDETPEDSEDFSDEESETEVVETEKCKPKKKKCEEDDGKEDDNEEVVEVEKCNPKKKKCEVECSFVIEDAVKKFSISLQEKIYALTDLVNAQYSESDNTWYSVTAYDDYVVMCDWFSGKYYKQTYSEADEVFTLTGDRVQVFAEFVTEDELKSLNAMRSNYSEICDKLAKYEAEPKKMEILTSVDYAQIYELEEFKELSNPETHFDMSVEEIQSKCDEILLSYAKNNKIDFSVIEEPKKIFGTRKITGEKPAEKKRYGGMFNK